MPFIKQKGLDGLVWVPAASGRGVPRKRNCPDCEVCQHCADSRCRACLRRRSFPKARGGKGPT